MTPEVIPWMSPCLSQSMSFVLAGIGHPMKFRRGDVIYTSPGLFGNLMYVRSGFVVKARMGMFLNYSGTVEERLGALLLLMLHCEKPAAMANLFSKGVEWVELPFYPDKGTIARLLGCKFETVSDVVRQWGSHDDIRRRSRRIWLRRRTFLKYWEWLMPFMQQSRAEERAAEALRQARRREEYDSF